MTSRRTIPLVWVLLGCGSAPASPDSGMPDVAIPDSSRDTAPPDAGPDVPYERVALYTELDVDDRALVAEVERVLIGNDVAAGCAACHGMTERRVREWSTATQAGLDCIGDQDPNFDGVDILNCFVVDEHAQPSSMGFLSTALDLPWFSLAMDRALDDAAARAYRGRASMPKPPVDALTQHDVDVLLTWVGRGMPLLADTFRDGGADCTPSVSTSVDAHVAAMATEGWAVLNRDAGLPMFGCDSTSCLSAFPLARDTEYGATWAADGDLRVLFEYTYASSFWTRSSADGRFVSHGGGEDADSSIIDLERRVVVGADAFYDPGFFPDNSGFVLQGAGRSDGGGFCSLDVLLDEPDHVTFGEAGCDVLDTVGLYQHMAAVQGGDYWTIFGQFVSDDGGHEAITEQLPAEFDSKSRLSLVPIIHEGNRYRPRDEISIATPFEGDSVISPSGRLVISRTRGADGAQSGFVMRQVRATAAGDSYDVELDEVARYCTRGSKVGFSFDERWLTFHRYVVADDASDYGFEGPGDPAYSEYLVRGAANVFVLDVLTGDTYRVTNMPAGVYALFPHFRSDGWLYFIVRDALGESHVERVVASNFVVGR